MSEVWLLCSTEQKWHNCCAHGFRNWKRQLPSWICMSCDEAYIASTEVTFLLFFHPSPGDHSNCIGHSGIQGHRVDTLRQTAGSMDCQYFNVCVSESGGKSCERVERPWFPDACWRNLESGVWIRQRSFLNDDCAEEMDTYGTILTWFCHLLSNPQYWLTTDDTPKATKQTTCRAMSPCKVVIVILEVFKRVGKE